MVAMASRTSNSCIRPTDRSREEEVARILGWATLVRIVRRSIRATGPGQRGATPARTRP